MYQIGEKGSYYALFLSIVKGMCAEKAVRRFKEDNTPSPYGYIPQGKARWSMVSQAIARNSRSYTDKYKMNEV